MTATGSRWTGLCTACLAAESIRPPSEAAGTLVPVKHGTRGDAYDGLDRPLGRGMRPSRLARRRAVILLMLE